MKLSKLENRIMQDGRTKLEIAQACGFANTRLSEYLHGKKEVPALHLMQLANVLHCPPRELVGEIEISDANV